MKYTYKQKGGKLIGKGGYGCVYDPPLRCQGEEDRPKHTISKIMKTNHAEDELERHQKVDEIDPRFQFHLKTPEKCSPALPDSRHDNKLKDCNLFHDFLHDGISDNESDNVLKRKLKYFSLLRYRKGGIDLNKFLKQNKSHITSLSRQQKETLFLTLFFRMSNLMYGLHRFKQENFVHADIKLENILYNQEEKKFYYIDFGLSGSISSLMNDSIFKNTYPFWPLELQLAYKKHRSPVNIDSVRRELKREYRMSKLKQFDTMVQRSLYQSTYLIDDILHQYMNNIKRSRQNVKRKMLEKLDIFSLGIVLIELWVDIFGQKFPNHTNTISSRDFSNDYIPYFKEIIPLIAKMVEPIYHERMNATILWNQVKKLKQRWEESETSVTTTERQPQRQEIARRIRPDGRPCPDNKIVNPRTGRCIQPYGQTAKKLNLRIPSEIRRRPSQMFPVNQERLHSSFIPRRIRPDGRPCPDNKIVNPHTGRCIKPNGPTAKRLGIRNPPQE